MNPSMSLLFALALAPLLAVPGVFAQGGRDLSESRAQAQAAFVSHRRGQPYLDALLRLPPAPIDPPARKAYEAFRAALREAREVQEGCALPCTDEADKALYIEKVRIAAGGLGAPAEAAVENYAPQGVPRKRAGAAHASAGSPSPLEAQALARMLERPGLPSAQRAALMGKAGRWADLLNLRRDAGSMGDGSAAVRADGRRTPQETLALLRDYARTPAGDSRHLRTLTVRAPPKVRVDLPPEPGLTRMERLALWIDEKVGSRNIEKASNFSAGFGDTISFGATRWIRKKQGTDAFVNANSGAYGTGQAAGALHALLMGGAGVLKPVGMGMQTVARWAPTVTAEGTTVLRQGQFVMAGTHRGLAGILNWAKAGGPELALRNGAQYMKAVGTTVPAKALRYPIAEEGRIAGTIKGLMGQRVYKGPPPVLPIP